MWVSILFPILSNGTSYFPLHIKPNTRKNLRLCLQYKLPWEKKIKMTYQGEKYSSQQSSETQKWFLWGNLLLTRETWNRGNSHSHAWKGNSQFDLLCVHYIKFICCPDYKLLKGLWGWRTVYSTAISSKFFLFPTGPDIVFQALIN